MVMAATLDSHMFDPSAWNLTLNVTQYVASTRYLALAGPRMFTKLAHFFIAPNAMDHILGTRWGQTIVAEATGARDRPAILDVLTTTIAPRGAEAAASNPVPISTQFFMDIEQQTTGAPSSFTMDGVRSIGNLFSYATSKWALCCVFVAVILNRTNVYARMKWNLTLPWKVRLLLRLAPILLLAAQCRYLLQSIQCQTSPEFSMLRWGNASRHSNLLFTQNGGFLHEMSSSLLLKPSDKDSCLAVDMIPRDYDDEAVMSTASGQKVPVDLMGSLSLLWPLFKTFAFSQFIETISCAVQGRQLAGETGMTFFEHSLAFAEAEGIVSNQIGIGKFGTTRMAPLWTNTSAIADLSNIAITRSMILKKVNTTPEVLLVGYISAMNHLTSQILAIFNQQARFRLLNTGFWGLAYMAAIVLGIWSFSFEEDPNQSLLRFPTVCIISFIPHVLVFCGIIGCALIYSMALLLSALAPPATEEVDSDGHRRPKPPGSLGQRLRAAHRNMQANVPLANIHITLRMDFYTALLRIGFSVMTMASEAVYLNESRGVSIKEYTWLEEDRLREVEAIGMGWLGPAFQLYDEDLVIGDGLSDHIGLVPAQDPLMNLHHNCSSGYAREMTTKSSVVARRDRGLGIGGNGIGAQERSGRWYMALEFCLGIGRLLLSFMATLMLKLMARLGIQSQPRWLLWMIRVPKTGPEDTSASNSTNPESLKSYLIGLEAELELPKDKNMDLEAELRQRLHRDRQDWTDAEEKKLDASLYTWWLSGGLWGHNDNSGTFVPSQREQDEDTTSVVSSSTTADHGWESDSADDEGDGRPTPTQGSPQFSREASPFYDTTLNISDLAQLLHPKTPGQRAEAEALSAHLSNDQVVTRARYRRLQQRARAQVLTSSIQRPANFQGSSCDGRPTAEEEAQILEHLIISRRKLATESHRSPASSWARGASGLGESGPQCVVCQCAPRSVIVWPCRCLSLCDDCRVNLAINNFEKCVCCRRDVSSFSRIFVP